jgi:hypothetical protein
MQAEAMYRSHSNNPIGKRYNEAYALLEKPVPELARINKTDRNQFIWCWQHRAWLLFLIGGAPFFMLLGGLAVALPFFWPWYLTAPPLICAFLGATITANWLARRGPL